MSNQQQVPDPEDLPKALELAELDRRKAEAEHYRTQSKHWLKSDIIVPLLSVIGGFAGVMLTILWKEHDLGKLNDQIGTAQGQITALAEEVKALAPIAHGYIRFEHNSPTPNPDRSSCFGIPLANCTRNAQGDVLIKFAKPFDTEEAYMVFTMANSGPARYRSNRRESVTITVHSVDDGQPVGIQNDLELMFLIYRRPG